MSEQTTEAAEATAAEPTATENVEQGDPAELGDAGKRAIAAEREARKAAEKQAAEFKARLDQIEQANLSDLERAQKQAADAQAAAEKASVEALRWRIAAKHGISDEDAETFLTAGDEESLTRQAERLVALAKTPTTPKPDPSQGARGGAAPTSKGDQFASWFEGQLS